MILRIPGRIPIAIHGTFWLTAALIGYLSTHSLLGVAVWVVVIFVSVLFHELGHALTALAFNQHPRIELVTLGGLTYHDNQKIATWKQLLIVFNGPLFGFLLFATSASLLYLPSIAESTLAPFLSLIRYVNFFWTVVNLLPLLPLDGGQLLRIVLEKIGGLKGFKCALLIGIILGVSISLLAFAYQQFFIGALFFLFAFQNYDSMRRTRHLSESDRNDTVRHLIGRIEDLLRNEQKEQAAQLCEEVRKQAKNGLLFSLATQYLAFLKYEKGIVLESYELLLSIKEDLASDALCLLHKIAFEQQNFALVIELGPTCFQSFPTAETALRNALAHAELKQPTPAIGWFRAAVREGLTNAEEIAKVQAFDQIRKDPVFEEFLKDLQK